MEVTGVGRITHHNFLKEHSEPIQTEASFFFAVSHQHFSPSSLDCKAVPGFQGLKWPIRVLRDGGAGDRQGQGQVSLMRPERA